MTRLLLSTGNCMSAGPSVIRKHGVRRSNLELVNSLRDNFSIAKRDSALLPTRGVDGVNGFSDNRPLSGPGSVSWEDWTERQGKTLFIPRLNGPPERLKEEAENYEITLKMFFLPGASAQGREQYARDALSLVQKELGIQKIDLLVVSFPGMSFEGSCEWEADKINAQQGNMDEEVLTWNVFEALHAQGIVKRLGVSEFGSEKLGAFIKRTSVKPAVDQINIKDCCSVPPPLVELARNQGVELNVHTDCTDILPRGTLRELLRHDPPGAGILADHAEGDTGPGLKGEIEPQWVVRYTAFVKNRGVIENKGYFAGAELHDAWLRDSQPNHHQ